MGDEEKQEIRLSLEEKISNEENVAKISEIKAKISEELENIEKSLSKIDQIKNESIEKIETKKKELREINDPAEVCKEHHETMKELTKMEKEIQERKFSITLLDTSIAQLDEQIAKIQAEHDRAVAELEMKKRKLSWRLNYYDELTEKLAELAQMLQEESEKFEEKLNDLKHQRSALLKRTDLSETTLNRMLKELDDQIEALNQEHDLIIGLINQKLSDYAVEPLLEKEIAVELLSEEQIKDLHRFEAELAEKQSKMTKEERLALLRMGLQITPSGRIITKDDKIISLEEARRLGLLAYLSHGYYDEGEEDDEENAREDEEEDEEEDGTEIPESKFPEKGLFYDSISSQASSTLDESSSESTLSGQDIEYLKRVFGKSLSLALAEITAVQPSDPIHYLAHWLIKYRYNQEIDEVKRIELQALMIERERLEAERWHAELEEEAKIAVLEALFRAENLILRKEYDLNEMYAQETEGEYETNDAFNPQDMIF